MSSTCRSSRVASRAAAARASAVGGMLVTLAFVVPSAFAGAGSKACASHASQVSCCAASRAVCTAASVAADPCASSASTGTASSAASASATAPSASVPIVPGESFLRAERDLETGGWTLAPLWATTAGDNAAALNQSSAGLIPVTLPNGAVAVDLQGRFQSYSVARRTLDGEVESGCLDSPSSLFLWFYGLPPATPPVARVER